MRSSQSAPAGHVYGAVCRVNFWVKMTTALGVTQLSIGIVCMAFYLIVPSFCGEKSQHLVRYMGVGLVAGSVILSSGLVALFSVKRRNKCTIMCFLVMSALAAMFALFPMVLGIVGASRSSEEEGLLMPICQLVFATVEIIVATWSMGVSCQALCCPNTTLGVVSARLPPGMGIAHLMGGEDGQHVVMFNTPHPPPGAVYTAQRSHTPILLQNGITSFQFAVQPSLCSLAPSCTVPHQLVGLTSHQPVGPAYITNPIFTRNVQPENGQAAVPSPVQEGERLLETPADPCSTPEIQPPQPTDTAESGFELEDEAVHLLG